jgi:hypothetical protein
VPYPTQRASALADELNEIASANGGNVFVSDLQPDPHGSDYRAITIDITRHDWHRIHPRLVAAGWSSYGDGGMVHSLPEQNYLVAIPSF